VATKPTFAEALGKRRCLIPADSFYEWQQLGPRKKRPWNFRLKDGSPFAFAGLWEAWRPHVNKPEHEGPECLATPA
jgi:putative SOS response-associated peptidase YedK